MFQYNLLYIGSIIFIPFLRESLSNYQKKMKRNKIKVIFVVGARPNFMKISPILESFKSKANIFESIIVHTGQHYDKKLSENILSI